MDSKQRRTKSVSVLRHNFDVATIYLRGLWTKENSRENMVQC